MPNPRKPTTLKKLEGTYRKDRAAKNEFNPSLAIEVEPPQDLNEWGAKLWVDLFEEFGKVALITRVDMGSLFLLCNEFGKYCEASDILSAKGMEIEEDVYNQKGEPVGTKTVLNPMLNVADKAFKNYKSMCTEFGLTPASRVKISAPIRDDNNELEGLLN